MIERALVHARHIADFSDADIMKTAAEKKLGRSSDQALAAFRHWRG